MNVLLMYEPSPQHLKRLSDAAPSAQIRIARDEPSAAQAIEDCEVVLGNRYFLQSIERARSLRWMQSNSMGVDLIVRNGAVPRNVIVTCARGVYDDEVAEHGVSLLLALTRGIHRARDQQREGRWQRYPLQTLSGRHGLVIGWGGVGRGIARRLRALGADTHAVRRRHIGPPAEDESGVLVFGPRDWRNALPAAEFLVLAVPLTDKTERLVRADELNALPAGGLVVNVGRGGTLDETALLGALASGHLGGAALDVTEAEPLPRDSPMWKEPRLLLTPHVGRSMEAPPFRWEGLFEENLRRYCTGEALLHVVDREAGY